MFLPSFNIQGSGYLPGFCKCDILFIEKFRGIDQEQALSVTLNHASVVWKLDNLVLPFLAVDVYWLRVFFIILVR